MADVCLRSLDPKTGELEYRLSFWVAAIAFTCLYVIFPVSTGVAVPSNFVRAPTEPVETISSIIHVTADNIDIQMDTLDGEKSFHGTQMVAFQRNSESLEKVVLSPFERQGGRKLRVPAEIKKLLPPRVQAHKTEPVFRQTPKLDWFNTEEMPVEVQTAKVLDLAFLLHRDKASQVSFISRMVTL